MGPVGLELSGPVTFDNSTGCASTRTPPRGIKIFTGSFGAKHHQGVWNSTEAQDKTSVRLQHYSPNFANV